MKILIETAEDVFGFTPQIAGDLVGYGLFGIMLVQLEICPSCEKSMIAFDPKCESLFPRGFRIDARAQLGRAGWAAKSKSKKDNANICLDCEDKGMGSFTCFSCKLENASNRSQYSLGYPDSTSLCKTCYESIPAAKWDALLEEINEFHRYDNC